MDDISLRVSESARLDNAYMKALKKEDKVDLESNETSAVLLISHLSQTTLHNDTILEDEDELQSSSKK